MPFPPPDLTVTDVDAKLAPPSESKPPPAAPSRTASGGFKTSEGTLYVSKPFRSKTSKKLRAMITFAPRKSHFDTTNENSGVNEFRGFFTLFWISMFLFTVRTYIYSHEQNGYILNLAFATMFSEDAITLAISDAVLVASTVLCVPFAQVVAKGWIPRPLALLLHHSYQLGIVATAITWTFNRQWPWVQSGFLTLHSLVMLMKMHSYLAVNTYLKDISDQADAVYKQLESGVTALGGWEQATKDAIAHRAELDEMTAASTPSAAEGTPIGTPMQIPIDNVMNGQTSSYVDVPTAAALRKRLMNVSSGPSVGTPSHEAPPFNGQASPPATGDLDTPASVPPEKDAPPTLHVLVDHPNESLAALARDWVDLVGELTSKGPAAVRWPANLTYRDFALYQLVPTLVYELEYPRTDRIRPLYVFEKTVAFMGTFALLYTVTETFILPLTPTKDQSFARSLLDLALPFMIAYLLLFYIIFECICNGFAELSYFADRQFYEDWWNSTSWDEFARKWNKPVHTFLLRHVYASTMTSYKLSRQSAMFITFLVSAIAHEVVMVVVTQKFRMYLFILQLIQIPLIAIGRWPPIKRNKLMGNIVFWLGLYAGFPLLCVAYVAY